MQNAYEVRASFIISYLSRRCAATVAAWAIIEENDARIRELNRAHGFTQPDGTVPLGCRTHVDATYKSKYDAVHAENERRYKEVTSQPYAQDSREGITIWEYLLLYNVDSEAAESLRQAAEKGGYQNFIQIRAHQEVQAYAAGRAIEDILKRLQLDKSHFRYAMKNCRRFFGFSAFDLSSLLAMWSFRRIYLGYLHESVQRLTLPRQSGASR